MLLKVYFSVVVNISIFQILTPPLLLFKLFNVYFFWKYGL